MAVGHSRNRHNAERSLGMRSVLSAAVYYRYLATDASGSYALLSRTPLQSQEGSDFELRLLEETDDYVAACRAHRALEERLRQPRRRIRIEPRGPVA